MITNTLWINEKQVIHKIKQLIQNGEKVSETHILCLSKIHEFIQKQKKIKCIYGDEINYFMSNSKLFYKKLCLKIENTGIVQKCLINIQKEMEITEIISIICVKKNLPKNCISKNIFTFLKINFEYD
tara:strand:- start:321 stop:701 length:381 start_codon:yes stop_codon:yes gene_type:complete